MAKTSAKPAAKEAKKAPAATKPAKGAGAKAKTAGYKAKEVAPAKPANAKAGVKATGPKGK